MAHTDSCEQGFACNAYYKLYYYIKLFRKVKQFFKNTAPFARKNQIFCVRGNCDTEVDQMVLHFPIEADFRVEELCDRRVEWALVSKLPPTEAEDDD